MNFSNECSLSSQQDNYWNEKTIEKQVVHYHPSNCRLEKLTIQINFTQDHQIIYSRNGVTLKIVELHSLKNPEIFDNLIWNKSTIFLGKLKMIRKKIRMENGLLIGIKKFCQMQVDIIKLFYLRLYVENEQKKGLWTSPNNNYFKQLIQNYLQNRRAQVFERGEYYYGVKSGKWIYLYDNKQIGEGRYNKYGYKCGKWFDFDKFLDASQIIYIGEYNKNGMKVGQWDIMYKQFSNHRFKQMQLLFKYEGIQIEVVDHMIKRELEKDWKMDRIRRIILSSQTKSEQSMIGEMELDLDKLNLLKNMFVCGYSGGGSYNYEGRQIGKWIELDERFDNQMPYIYNGEYNKKGMKIGKWEQIDLINYKKSGEMKYIN